MANLDDVYRAHAECNKEHKLRDFEKFRARTLANMQQYCCPVCGQSGMEQHSPKCWVGQQQMAGMQNVNMQFISSPELDAQIKPPFEQERLYARLKTGPWLSRLLAWLREFPR